jgi:PAS domain S-box-containing protein
MLVEDDTDEHLGRFHCNANGENISVNRLYARWLGVGKLELLGWKFLNYIHPEDVFRVRTHWDSCRAEHRPYHTTFRMISTSGEIFTVEVSATPIPEVLPAKRWVGVVRRIHGEHHINPD